MRVSYGDTAADELAPHLPTGQRSLRTS
jgi:hypothetical protein